MALLNIKDIKRIQGNGYSARINGEGYLLKGCFSIYSCLDGIMVCTREGRIPEDGEVEDMCIRVEGLTPRAKASEDEIEQAFLKFIRNQ